MSEPTPPPPRRPRPGRLLREIVVVVLGALVVSTLLRVFVGQMFLIPSGSMEHTLDVDDRVAVSKLSPVHRGQVVVFSDPGGWLDVAAGPDPTPVRKALGFIGFPVDATTTHLVKRVIGLPGDHVVCCDDQHRITVNGHPLEETAYLYRDGGDQVRPSEWSFDVVVPAGRLWVMGDHRDHSGDSRCHLGDTTLDGIAGSAAFVPESDVVGPAVAITYPFDRARRLRVPTTFDAVPDPSGPAPSEPVISQDRPAC